MYQAGVSPCSAPPTLTFPIGIITGVCEGQVEFFGEKQCSCQLCSMQELDFGLFFFIFFKKKASPDVDNLKLLKPLVSSTSVDPTVDEGRVSRGFSEWF